jgi:hypothetical protein
MKDPSSSRINTGQLMVLNEVITSHLGINPVKGGRPASESNKILNIISVCFEYIKSDGI